MAAKRIEIDGMTCVTGMKPESGVTVGAFMERLSQFEPSLPLGFSTGPDANLEILSVYETRPEEGPLAVWIDLGEPEADDVPRGTSANPGAR